MQINIFDSSIVTEIGGVLVTTPPNQIVIIEFTTPDDSNLGILFYPSVFDSSAVTDIVGVLVILPPRQIPLIEFPAPTDVLTQIIIRNLLPSLFDSSAVTESITIVSGNFYNIQPAFDECGVSDQTGFALFFGNNSGGAGTPIVSRANNAVYQSLTAITIEAWVYIVDNSTLLNRILEFSNTGANTGYYLALINPYKLTAYVGNSSSNSTITSANNTIALNQWIHVAITWNGNTTTLWINGVSSATGSLSGGNTGNPAVTLTASGTNRIIPGAAKEIRLSNIARYTSNFTVPTAEFTNDSNTILLWHFDGGSGTSATDSSSNNLSGTLSGSTLPKWITSNAPITGYAGTTAIVNLISVGEDSVVTGVLTNLEIIFLDVMNDISTVTDAIVQVLITQLFISSTFDASAVTENIAMKVIDFLNVSDSSSVSENVAIVITCFLSIFENSVVTENFGSPYAIQFNGNSTHTSYVSIKSTGSILGGLTNSSIAFQFKTSATTDGAIYCERGNSGNDIWRIALIGNKIQFSHRDDGGTDDEVATLSSYNDGALHFCVVTKSGTSINIYVDDMINSAGTGTLTGTDNFTNASVQSLIGGDAAATSFNISYILSNLLLYNSVLNSTQRTTLNLGGSVSSGLLDSYPMTEGTGTTTSDTTGSNNGTFSGTTLPTWTNGFTTNNVEITKFPSIAENSAVTESVSIFITILYLSVFDSSTVTDVITNIIVYDLETIFDATAVSENISINTPVNITINDSSTTSEAILLITEIYNINVFEGSSVTESTAINFPVNVNVSDSSTVSENFVVESIEVNVVFDASTVTESVIILISDLDVVFDSSTVTENIILEVISIIGIHWGLVLS